MMEIKIKIKENNDGREQLERILAADDMAGLLFELKYNFWRRWKHGDVELTIDDMNEYMDKLFIDHRINIDELIS